MLLPEIPAIAGDAPVRRRGRVPEKPAVLRPAGLRERRSNGRFPLDRAEYDKLDRVEAQMWWFAALHANLLDRLRQANIPPGPVLDAGCGTGGLLARLAAGLGGGRAVGLDADLYACRFAHAKSAAPVCAGSVDVLPFADRSFAAILSADVLCHAGVDEERALAEFHRCLAPGGALILNLPAYRWMLSRHDIAVANVRRYTGRGITARLHAAGFRGCRTTYWNAVLFPVMVATRKLWRGGDDGSSDVRLYPAAVDALCRVATGLERMVFACGLRLPFGGSLIAVASKEK